MYYVVKTAFHGGGVISRHRKEERAKQASKKWRAESCVCGCCGVVDSKEYDKLQEAQESWSPYSLAK